MEKCAICNSLVVRSFLPFIFTCISFHKSTELLITKLLRNSASIFSRPNGKGEGKKRRQKKRAFMAN